MQLGGFDTHSGQGELHGGLMSDLSNSIGNFFTGLQAEHSERVALMTYSEFGRRVKENGSRGTDHGSGSCMFVAGSQVVGGMVGKHPSLSDLTDGDVKYHTDFRRVYATLLDDWLEVDSKGVLDDKYDKLPLIDRKKKAPAGGADAAGNAADRSGRRRGGGGNDPAAAGPGPAAGREVRLLPFSLPRRGCIPQPRVASLRAHPGTTNADRGMPHQREPRDREGSQGGAREARADPGLWDTTPSG